MMAFLIGDVVDRSDGQVRICEIEEDAISHP
jgi:hypothetical protein